MQVCEKLQNVKIELVLAKLVLKNGTSVKISRHLLSKLTLFHPLVYPNKNAFAVVKSTAQRTIAPAETSVVF